MRRQICALILVVLLFALVQCKTSIEIDENGDEYEVKRFHIQGRDVNDPRPQCVVTRRKRSSADGRQYNVDPITDLVDDTDEKEINNPEEEEIEDNEDKEENEEHEEHDTEDEEDMLDGIEVNDNDEKPIVGNTKDKHIIDMDKDNKEIVQIKKTTNITDTTIKVHNITEIKKKSQNTLTLVLPDNLSKDKIQKVTLLLPQKETMNKEEKNKEQQQKKDQITIVQPTIQLLPQTIHNNVRPPKDNLYVIPAHKPSKQTAFIGVLPTTDDYATSDAIDPYASWTYSVNPATTTALWSTGDDVPQNIHNKDGEDFNYEYVDNNGNINTGDIPDLTSPADLDYNYVDMPGPSVAAVAPPSTTKKPAKKPNKRPGKVVKKKKRPNKKTKRKTKKPTKNSKRPQQSKRPRRPQRPNKKYIRPVVIRRQRPNVRRRVKPIHSARGQTDKKTSKKENKKQEKPIGTITTTTTTTTTDTGDEGNIDCIIINKDIANTSTSSTTSTTTTTTRRPFWNFLGRAVNRRVSRPRDFGNRKRATLRFTA